jgi:hypothetical protein
MTQAGCWPNTDILVKLQRICSNPPFFCNNHDDMEAFKQYWEVAQDPESMGENLYNYVHQDLIQQLWQKAEQIGL